MLLLVVMDVISKLSVCAVYMCVWFVCDGGSAMPYVCLLGGVVDT